MVGILSRFLLGWPNFGAFAVSFRECIFWWFLPLAFSLLWTFILPSPGLIPESKMGHGFFGIIHGASFSIVFLITADSCFPDAPNVWIIYGRCSMVAMSQKWKGPLFQIHTEDSGLIIFHQPGFPWNFRGPISLPKRYLFRSQVVWGRDEIWPECMDYLPTWKGKNGHILIMGI